MATRSMKVLKTLADKAFEPEKKPKLVMPKKKNESNYEVIMTKEEIEQYIDLDNKIKNRIVQISHALKKVKKENVCHFLKKTYVSFDPSIKRSEFFDVDFGTELQFHPSETSDSNGYGYLYFSKELLTLTDEQINEIVEYDKKRKEEEYKRQKEASKARKEKIGDRSRRKGIRTASQTEEEI